ncbi:hypothetical protein CERZMDRAFT_97161 [Cercospora zeae-maydis SCOH1-5]|uniref:Uncharacterized protein n=1 Tax=Cercospora zeae-maydis SCOH1-5 TaxID=717836 RepID=A0A6A6FH91_9PEZI|nr:hypothetical protein CERZMDRAFT_97161 [Cercospora zeae-maydis SCOH1-5]
MIAFRAATSELLESGKFSDFIIICGTTGREYKVHRSVVSSQSKWSDRCCSRDFLEGRQGFAILREDDPTAFEKMLITTIEYFYKFDSSDDFSTIVLAHGDCPADLNSTGDVMDDDDTGSIIKSSIQLHAHYEVPDLKGAAQLRFREELAANMESLSVITDAITAVYKEILLPHSDRALKDLLAIAWVVPGNRRHLQDHAEELKDVLEANPEFLFDAHVLLLQGFTSSTSCPRSIILDQDIERIGQNSWLECHQCGHNSYPHRIEFTSGIACIVYLPDDNNLCPRVIPKANARAGTFVGEKSTK